jgi:hypothetical protein
VSDEYKRGVRDAFNELLRINSLPLARWNLAQLLQSELPTPEDYAEGYRHGREDALKEAASVLRRYGLFTGENAAEAVERVKR